MNTRKKQNQLLEEASKELNIPDGMFKGDKPGKVTEKQGSKKEPTLLSPDNETQDMSPKTERGPNHEPGADSTDKGISSSEEIPIPKSSLLTELENTFGVQRIEPYKTKFNGIEFTLRALSSDLLAFATRISESGVYDNTEESIRLRIAISACAISSIKGIPVHEVFEVKPLPGEELESFHYPSSRLMEETAKVVYEWLSKKANISIVDNIQDIYNREIYPQTLVEEDISVRKTSKPNSISDTLGLVIKVLPFGFVSNEGMDVLNKLHYVSTFIGSENSIMVWTKFMDWIAEYLPEGMDIKVEGEIAAILKSSKI